MKFAMIPINRRYDKKSNRVIRRVLISYKKKLPNGKYAKTKLIYVDPYFTDPNSSHQYVFTNKYFYLSKSNEIDKFLINEKRHYMYKAGLLKETAIEFEANNKEEAITAFMNRSEVH